MERLEETDEDPGVPLVPLDIMPLERPFLATVIFARKVKKTTGEKEGQLLIRCHLCCCWQKFLS